MKAREHLTAARTQITLSSVYKQSIERGGRRRGREGAKERCLASRYLINILGNGDHFRRL